MLKGYPSGTAASHVLVELLQRDSGSRALIQGCVPGQGLGDAVVVVLEDGRQGFQKVSGKDGPLCLRKVKRQLLDVCDGGHVVDSSEFGRWGKWHPRPYHASAPVQDPLGLAFRITNCDCEDLSDGDGG